jgi:lipoprotein-anchoring transpeptidase ErfK/SrfK
MNVHRHLIFLVLAFLISGCASTSLTRTAALELHQKLGQSHVAASYPEEYQSFIASIAHAETLSQRGELLQAENVFSLALLKGRLLQTRSAESALVVPAAAPGWQKIAQAEAIPVDSSTPGIVEESLTPEPSPSDVPPPLPEEQVLPQPESSPEPAPSAPPATLLPPEPEQPPLPPDLPGEEQPTADMKRFIGNRGYYTVRKWDTLKRVGARLGVDWRRLVKINNLDPKAQLKPGQIIAYDNRKIVPSALRDGIVINIADRTLYLLKNGEVRTSYPVALGKPPKPEQDEDWSTPTGRFVITSKEKDPVWRVPQSIQDEMEERGRQPVKEVPPGKDNPLGKFAMKTSLSGIVIHSTNSPSSINTYASHGCIRVMPEHMEHLFLVVEPRTSGIIVYQPVKLAVSQYGRIFLEVHRDIYDRYKGNLESEVRKLISKRKVEEQVDWRKISALLRKKSGIPEEITIDPADTPRLKSSVTGKQNTVSINRTSSSPLP